MLQLYLLSVFEMCESFEIKGSPPCRLHTEAAVRLSYPPNWVRKCFMQDVFYEINIRQFTRTSVIEKRFPFPPIIFFKIPRIPQFETHNACISAFGAET